MAGFDDEDMLLNSSLKDKKAKAKNENLDSDDKEVEDLFKDSSDSATDQLDSFKRHLNSKNGMGHRRSN